MLSSNRGVWNTSIGDILFITKASVRTVNLDIKHCNLFFTELMARDSHLSISSVSYWGIFPQ